MIIKRGIFIITLSQFYSHSIFFLCVWMGIGTTMLATEKSRADSQGSGQQFIGQCLIHPSLRLHGHHSVAAAVAAVVVLILVG